MLAMLRYNCYANIILHVIMYTNEHYEVSTLYHIGVQRFSTRKNISSSNHKQITRQQLSPYGNYEYLHGGLINCLPY